MAESICRALRDGALQGELAPALTIKDSIASPFGFHVFTHLLTQLSTNILAAKSQSRNVKDMDKLYSSIIELGKGIVGQGKVRFCGCRNSWCMETSSSVIDVPSNITRNRFC
ncbi:elongator complex protein 5-like isoform X2 [Quercus robur]|uniref:elongator complex protein 5-like isoform X2 n=1 Tax=Quercus robur TaxID=38942 RepID=UPI0021632B93|nr:elongator complex protein 5-like isoform X2 [Quercus robur]